MVAPLLVGGAAVAGGLVKGIAGLFGAGKRKRAAEQAAAAQRAAFESAISEVRMQDQFNQRQYSDFLGRTDQFNQGFNPFIQRGQFAAQQIDEILSGRRQFAISPAAQAAIRSGTQAAESSAAARGMLQSGQTLRALQGLGQTIAQSDLDRQRQELLAAYGNIANQGFAAQSSLRVAGPYQSNVGSSLASLIAQQGAAQAAGIQGSAQASSDQLNSIAGIFGDTLGGVSGALGFQQQQQAQRAALLSYGAQAGLVDQQTAASAFKNILGT